MVPQVLQLAFVIFQQYNIDHLGQVFEVGRQWLFCYVFDHSFHPSFPGQLCNHFHLVHGSKYSSGRYRSKTSMAASRLCSFVRRSHPVICLKNSSDNFVIPGLGADATKSMP